MARVNLWNISFKGKKNLKDDDVKYINKLFDKNVNVIKNLVNKIGDLSKIMFEQRNFYYMMKVIIYTIPFTAN